METVNNEVKITERGWAGHFICADRCLFHRNTLLEYADRKWIVSTVGNMRVFNHIAKKYEMDTIGYNRWYETQAFVAESKKGYIDADVSHPISFDSEWGIFGRTLEEMLEKYETPDNAANQLHENVVKELCQKIKELT